MRERTNQIALPLRKVDTSNETPEERVRREAEARWDAKLVLGQLFGWLKANVGVEDAWHIFNKWTESARPRSLMGHRGPSNPEHDVQLLALYDQITSNQHERSGLAAKRLAKFLHDGQPGLYGNSVDAIVKKIGRLLKKRDGTRADAIKLNAEMQNRLQELEMGGSDRGEPRPKSRDK